MALGLLIDLGRCADRTEDVAARYRSLRKDFFVVMALPRARRGMRPEHLKFLKKASRFVRDVEEASPPTAAGALYLRGRLLQLLRIDDKARADFDQVLAVLDESPDDRPGGLPNAATVAVFRAFTFLPAGPGRVLEALEEIDPDGPAPLEAEVGDLVREWADRLADGDRVTEALRALEFVQTFTLWTDRADDPERKIALLKYRMEQAP